jgi:uncharacterized protein YraI
MPSYRFSLPTLSHPLRYLTWTLFVLALASGVGLLNASAAQAAQAFATSNVNMRAGPATDYPVVTTLSAGELVTVYGCLGDGSWCDVSTPGNRGWVSTSYLSTERGSRVGVAALALPAVAFSYAYWDTYYARRPWYNTWWGHGRPRPPHYHPPGYRPPGYHPPGYRPPGIHPPHPGRPPHLGPPNGRPPHVRPPHGRPPHVRPPHGRPPHAGRPSTRPIKKRPVIAPRPGMRRQ